MTDIFLAALVVVSGLGLLVLLLILLVWIAIITGD